MSGRATPATSAAQRAGIRFAIHQYAHDPAAESYGLEAAQALGIAPERVFKTLIASLDERRHAVAIVPVQQHLNLKAVAAALGAKRAAMADPSVAQRLTGYVVGGISPLGQKSRLPAALDASALAHPTIYVSAGRRGLEIELAPADLARLIGAVTAEIAS
jgi:Cys-tRNA(Pro)/Cys-tRNA(Cys) deacylase